MAKSNDQIDLTECVTQLFYFISNVKNTMLNIIYVYYLYLNSG